MSGCVPQKKRVCHPGGEKDLHHGFPRHVGDGFQLVVDVQLRGHHDEAEGVDEAHEAAQRPRVEALAWRGVEEKGGLR